MDPKLADSLANLENALTRLSEALTAPEDDPLVVDASIQRFEFVIELFWKTFKRALAYEGIETATPREAVQQAFAVGWISDETAWLSMLRDRNLTSHVYDEAMAGRIYERIRAHAPVLRAAFGDLRQRYGSADSTDP